MATRTVDFKSCDCSDTRNYFIKNVIVKAIDSTVKGWLFAPPPPTQQFVTTAKQKKRKKKTYSGLNPDKS